MTDPKQQVLGDGGISAEWQDADTLVLTVTLGAGRQSASGKSLVLASTQGNVALRDHPGGRDVRLGLNLYEPAKEKLPPVVEP